jgi:hypothetical protein
MKRAFRIWHRALLNAWDREDARRLVRRAQARCAALQRRQPRPPNRRLGWHLGTFILPGLALYQELRSTGMSREGALTLAAELFAAWAEARRRRYARLGRLPFFYLLLRASIRAKMKREYPPEGWDMEWLEISDDRIAFIMRSCFYHEILTHHRVPELTRLFCEYDDRVFESMSPYVRWERAGTIARGGAMCDFLFTHARGQRARRKGWASTPGRRGPAVTGGSGRGEGPARPPRCGSARRAW